ncbi:MAG: recombinase family protein [Halothiobacillaceae bacterium]
MVKSVTTIPAKINKKTAMPIDSPRKRRVAAYARVSTDSEEQATSYEAQVDYYTNYIKNRKDWEFVRVYADEGITGTNTKDRVEFKAMINDALDGKIDLIITKSVSRFARNTVDTLTTVRKLKEKNIEVWFEKENIQTLDSKGELLITIMSSLAQEESRSISENCTWGQRKRFADGKVTVPFSRFLGYDRGEDGNLVVNPEEAKSVKLLYALFLEGRSCYGVAKELTARGIKTPGGKDKWSAQSVKSILTNEKYKGDALLQKSFTVDFLTKKKKKNEGEIPQYYVKDNHEAIIDPETFEMVQTLMTTRTKGRNRKSSVSIFSSKVKCGDCGSWYGPKVWHSNDAYRKVIWQCNHKFDGQKCATPTLTEDEIKELFLRAANQVIDQKEQFIAIYEQVLSRSLDTTALESELSDLEAEINIAAELIEECIKENAHVALDQDEYQKRYDALVARFDKAKARHTEVTDLIAERMARKHQIEAYLKNLRSREPLTEFWETDWLAMVDYITVHSKNDIRVTVKDGTEIKA